MSGAAEEASLYISLLKNESAKPCKPKFIIGVVKESDIRELIIDLYFINFRPPIWTILDLKQYHIS
jgi:hypothetical protein